MVVTRSRVASVAAVALVATIFPSLGGAGAQAAASTPDLLGGGSADTATPAGAERSRLAVLESDLLDDAGAGDRLAFTLFDDAVYTGFVTSVESRPGSTSWTGRLDSPEGGLPGTFNAVRVGSTYSLNLNTGDDVFEVTQVDADTYRISEALPRTGGGKDALIAPASSATAVSSGADRRLTTAAPGAPKAGADATTVDVMVAYTASALTTAGGEAPLKAQIQTAIDQTNQSFTNSQLTTRVRLVGTMQTTGTESGNLNQDTDLRALWNPSDGKFDDVQPARDAMHADLVSLWVGGSAVGSDTCGWGYYSTVPKPDPASGYSVVQTGNCATTYLVFTHELGHNFGADHDPTEFLSPNTLPYARGYFDAATRRVSIMSYYNACRSAAGGANCTRVPYFSGPSVLFTDGRPMGTATANNAKVIADSTTVVSNYRASVIYAGVPSITGKATVGQSLTAVPGTWAGATSFAYQWLADGVPIAGATGSTIKLASAQAGRTITVAVTGSGTNYAPVSATSPAGVKVANAAIAFKKPRLFGTPRVGNMLGVKVSTRVKNVSFKFVWYRDNQKIKGVRGPLYRLKAADRGAKVYVKVIAKKKGFSATTQKTKKVRVR